MKKSTKLMAGCIAGMLLLFIAAASCTTSINQGHAGIVYNYLGGGVERETLGQGMQGVAPWKKVKEYPVSTETVFMTTDNGGSFAVPTSESKQIKIDARYSYHMDVKRLPEIYDRFRGQDAEIIESGWIKSELQKAVRAVTSQYTVFDLNGAKVSEINAKVMEQLTKSLAADGIVLEEFSLGDIHPDAATEAAIQANVQAQMDIQKLELQKKQVEIEADKKRIEAQGAADSALIKAKGDAAANKVIQASLTPELVKLKMVEILPSIKFPTVMGGNSNILNMPAELLKPAEEAAK